MRLKIFERFRVNDEVIVIEKSVCGPKERSKFYNSKIKTYVVDINDTYLGKSVITVGYKNSCTGDYYLPSDLRHVNPLDREIDGIFIEILQDLTFQN